jgi:GT2 family glycosyltransferase
MLTSLAEQSVQPGRLLVVDASPDREARDLCEQGLVGLRSKLQWLPAREPGAAKQRNQAVEAVTEPFVWFVDDDVILHPNCLQRLSAALQAQPRLGGVNAFITNQGYHPPGFMTRQLWRLMGCLPHPTPSGRVIGPAINLLPDDRPELPEIVPVEWLNTTCTMYRSAALPDPPFDAFFEGYSLMEDLALSLNVAKRGWKLANVRTARIFHDSQPGEHKSDVERLSAMELVNRHYVMTHVLGHRDFTDYLRLTVYELFQLAATLRQSPRTVREVTRGKIKGVATIRRLGREEHR